jgi:hypothetical protein
MNRRQLGCVGWVLLISLLQGCASYEGVPNPAWFPRAAAAAESKTPGRIALWVQPQVQATVSTVGRVLRLQVGSIAERAVLATLDEGLQGGVQQIYGPPQAAVGYSATVVVDAVRFEHQERTLWFVWVPPLSGVSQYEATMTLAFDLSLFDARGRLVLRRTYDDDAGRLVWTTPSADSTPLPEDIGRVVHEAAWRLAQQVLRDVREWMDGERMRAREL